MTHGSRRARAGAWTPSSLRALHPEDLYLAYHAPRYALVLRLVAEIVAGWDAGGQERVVLDVGESVCTRVMAEWLEAREGGGATVHTLDVGADGARGHLGARSRNYRVDLNDACDAGRMRGDVPRGDVIVFAEVLEHLHCAPEHVLSWLASRLAPGGRIVLQTPNAVAAHKRALMLLGRHPFERLRLDPSCPGHVREHTLHELRGYARAAGLRVERVIRASYFDYRFRLDARTHRHVRTPWGAAGNIAYAMMPGFLARGITMVLSRERDV